MLGLENLVQERGVLLADCLVFETADVTSHFLCEADSGEAAFGSGL